MTDTRLDDAIDRAVREMMSVDPRPGLSRRVLARLDEPRTPWLTVPRRAAAAALVAVIVVAIVLVTRTPAPVSQQVSVTRTPASPAPQTEMHVPPTPADSTARVATHAPRARRTVRQPRATAEDIPPFAGSVNVDPLASIAPIAPRPVEPSAIESPEIIVTPLAPIEPVRVDPLPSRPR